MIEEYTIKWKHKGVEHSRLTYEYYESKINEVGRVVINKTSGASVEFLDFLSKKKIKLPYDLEQMVKYRNAH